MADWAKEAVMPEKVLIIGGGIAGLSAGCYLRMNGYETDIYELHDLPGGLCTSWKRGGFTFDFCIQWLMGSGPSKGIYNVWKELGAVQERKFIEWEEFTVFKSKSGISVTVYSDPGRLQQELLRIGPEDREIIGKFCGGIRKLRDFDIPARLEKFRLSDGFKLLRFIPAIMKWSRIGMLKFGNYFHNAVLKELFHSMYGEFLPDFPVAGMMMMLGFMNKKSAGYPLGGSLEFSRAIEKRYLGLGGRIHYGQRVDKIVVENGEARGIKVKSEEIRGDYIISAADGYSTIYTMLEGRFTCKEIDTAYNSYRRFPSLLYICLGIGRDLINIPVSYSFPLKKPIILERGALKLERLGIRNYRFDPGMAPRGKNSLIVMIPTYNDEFWTELKKSDPGAYQAEKKQSADQVIEALDNEFGDIRDRIEVIDVATPDTVIRYTGNWHGSFEGFLPTIKTMMKPLPSTLPGLSNFYLLGQWTTPGGGLPPAGMGGRNIARLICRKDGTKFKVS
jgi:phytoene dehydrogenase-like protein